MSPTVFVDESEPGDRRDPGAYILGAFTVPEEAGEDARTCLRRLKPRSASKLHWTESDDRHRTEVVRALASLPMTALGVVSVTEVTVRSERRRRLALERLVLELASSGFDEIILESRGPADRSDRVHIDGMRARRIVHAVRFEHVAGAREPLLWAADAICGVVALDHRGEGAYRELLGHRLSIVHNAR